MKINTYTICESIANRLKSKVLGTEANELQIYSLENFSELTRVYNQIAINKNKYDTPYVAISTIGQTKKRYDEVAIDIDFSIPTPDNDSIKEEIVDGVIVYSGREKVSEFAEIIMNIIDKQNCTGFNDAEILFQPGDIELNKKEFTGNVQVTYKRIIPISKFD